MSARFACWLPLLTLFFISGPASADATAPEPSKPPKVRQVYEPQGRMALLPLLPGMVPKKKSEIDVMDWTLLRRRKGQKSSWLTPARLHSKLVQVSNELKLLPTRRAALHVLIPCKVGDRAWAPDPKSKNKKAPPLPAALMPCLQTAVHPTQAGTVKGLVVVFDANIGAAKRRLTKLGFATKGLHSAMIAGNHRAIVELKKKLEGKIGLLRDPGRLNEAGVVSLHQIIVDPRRPPSHQKPKSNRVKPNPGRKKPKRGRNQPKRKPKRGG